MSARLRSFAGAFACGLEQAVRGPGSDAIEKIGGRDPCQVNWRIQDRAYLERVPAPEILSRICTQPGVRQACEKRAENFPYLQPSFRAGYSSIVHKLPNEMEFLLSFPYAELQCLKLEMSIRDNYSQVFAGGSPLKSRERLKFVWADAPSLHFSRPYSVNDPARVWPSAC